VTDRFDERLVQLRIVTRHSDLPAGQRQLRIRRIRDEPRTKVPAVRPVGERHCKQEQECRHHADATGGELQACAATIANNPRTISGAT
jgi:hypothetical protein